MKKVIKLLPHYSSLIGIFVCATLAFVLFSYDRVFQVIISIAVAVSYVVWGIVHHKMHDDLYLAVVIEYIAVATLGLVIIFSLIFRT